MKYKWFTAAFLSLCLIPAAGMLVLPEQQAAGNEHLTPKPSLWNAQTGWNAEFLGDLTDYVADHFGFRQELVTANAALQTGLLCTSPAEDVIYGTDGWLYYAKTLDDYQNHATLTESEAQQLAQTVKSMQDYCESRGARFLFTIAPNKSSLYPEHMPARYLTEDADGSYERVLPYLEQEGVNYADLFSVFRAHANVLYYKTDSHWTNRGAALAHDYLMNTLGLLDICTSGEYLIDGKDVSNLSDDELSEIRNKEIGFIFQGFNLIPSLTAKGNVELPLIYRGVKKEEREKLSVDALRRVGLEKRMNHLPSQMSGGQQQRVAIARAVAARPPIILADEPTGNLDSHSGKEVMKILHELNDEGRTIILITHDNEIAEEGTRVVRISDGRIIEDRPSNRV